MDDINKRVLEFAEQARQSQSAAPLYALLSQLEGSDGNTWMEVAKVLTNQGWAGAAMALLDQAEHLHGRDAALLYHRAGAARALGKHAESDDFGLAALELDPANTRIALFLASNLRERGQTRNAALFLRDFSAQDALTRDVQATCSITEFMREVGEPELAQEVIQRAIAGGNDAAVLHLELARTLLLMGEFVQARDEYLRVYRDLPAPHEALIAQGLAQLRRFDDPHDTDLDIIRDAVEAEGLSGTARASALFGYAKACDDLGDPGKAAIALYEANRLAAVERPFDIAAWQDKVGCALSRDYPAAPMVGSAVKPVFIVGMPRSGTTLLAELLSRSDNICNRGELGFVGHLDAMIHGQQRITDGLIDEARTIYLTHLVRDHARRPYYIDKNPLNFLYLGLIKAMFPDAGIVYLARSRRDVALSLWFQFFASELTSFCYDFSAMRDVMHDCDRIIEASEERGLVTCRVDYKDLVSSPAATVATLVQKLGIEGYRVPEGSLPERPRAIATASLWQARQGVHGSSVGKSQRYIPFIPELGAFEE